jgi:hypothetical protein
MDNLKHECRYAILTISYRVFLHIFTAIDDGFTIIRRIKLPKDAHIVSVHSDPITREWLVVLESDEFDIVLEGSEVPKLNYIDEFVKTYKIEEDINE